VGLAVAGLMTGLRVIGVAQAGIGASLGEAVSIRTAVSELDGVFRNSGPFRSDEPSAFSGDQHGFRFACGGGRCAATLEAGALRVQDGAEVRIIKLPRTADLRFSYAGSLGPAAAWPPAPLPPPAPQWQVLRSVSLVDATASRPVAAVRVWKDQRAGCEFDVVTRDCRQDPS